MGAERPVHLEEARHLVEHVVEAAGLVAAGASNVLPCMGSQIQATGAPRRVTFSTSGGRMVRILSAPIRVMKSAGPARRRG